MSWDHQARRQAAIASVLAYAARHPHDGLPYAQLPAVEATFPDRRELLLALQFEWTESLWARIEVLALAGGRRSHAAVGGAADVTARAWRQCARRQPVLRRLLDTYHEELGPPPIGPPPAWQPVADVA